MPRKKTVKTSSSTKKPQAGFRGGSRLADMQGKGRAIKGENQGKISQEGHKGSITCNYDGKGHKDGKPVY